MARTKTTPAVQNAKPAPAQAPKSVTLGAPTRADGSANAMLGATLVKKFSRFTIFNPDGSEKATLIGSDNPTNVGTPMKNFFFAMLDGWLSGVGHGPDGSRQYVAQNFGAVQKASTTKLGDYTLEAIPAGRSGVKGYVAKVSDVMTIINTHNAILVASEEKHGLQKSTTRASKKVEETPEVLF